MDKIKNLYGRITPKTDPADLAEKIIRGECTEKSSVKKHGRRFIGIASALCAALAITTVTVGAVSGWDFKGFFTNVFGGSTDNMREYIVDGGKVEIAAETFDKFDFTVTGLAADENMVYLGLDIISLDGETLPDDTRLGAWYGDEGGSQNVECIESSDGRYSCLVTLFGNYGISSTRKGTINISEIYSPDRLPDGGTKVYDNGILTINFDIENTLPEKKIEAPFELDIPALFYKDYAMTEGATRCTINKLSLSGMALVLDYEKPHDNAPRGFYDGERIYLLLNDGSRAAVKSIGAYGSSFSEDEINFTSETGKIMFLIPEPVDVNNVSALVFGDTVIYF